MAGSEASDDCVEAAMAQTGVAADVKRAIG
jgi:hypothetical protein